MRRRIKWHHQKIHSGLKLTSTATECSEHLHLDGDEPDGASKEPYDTTDSLAVVVLWDEVDSHLEPVEEDDDEIRDSPPERLHTLNTSAYRHLRAVHPDVPLAVKRRLSESTPAPDLAPIDGDPDPTATTTLSAPCAPDTPFRVSPKKRKITIMDQVSALVSESVAQLGEMDAAMQAQEDARLQLLMEHEREMQNNLLCQLTTMHDNIIKQNHERHLELVDRLLSRFPSSSSDS